MTNEKFLPEQFLQQYRGKQPPWGPVGAVTYYRTYARPGEHWTDTVERVVNGVYSWMKFHCKTNDRPWDQEKSVQSACTMYSMIWNMKWLPPGRGLWSMGTETLSRTGAAANNCGFTSTEDFPSSVAWLMNMLMLGVGVGFDTTAAGTTVHSRPCRVEQWTIPDTREGWCESVRRIIAEYVCKSDRSFVFDYEQIRPAGEPIRGFGGTASGPGPLKELHASIRKILDNRAGAGLTSADVVDVCNLVGRCVVAGNVRRSAEIAFAPYSDRQFLDLKNRTLYPEEVANHRWASNNSVICEPNETNYAELAERIVDNGEPGVFWLDNARAYSRMGRRPDWKDHRALGANPCVPGETLVLTNKGYSPIESLVGESTVIWNGKQWSEVVPRKTGENQPLVRVTLSDGSYLDCTPAHEWAVDGGEKKRADDLQQGDKLQRFSMPVAVEFGDSFPYAYTHGFFCGDGQGAGSKKGALLYGEKKKLIAHLEGQTTGKDLGQDRIWFGMPSDMAEKFHVPLNASYRDRLSWFAGLLDADGTLAFNLNSAHIQLSSVNKDFLLKVKLLLTTLGVQAKIGVARPAGKRTMPDGNGDVKEYDCKVCYRLNLNAFDSFSLKQQGLPCKRLRVDFCSEPQRDARQFVRVTSVEKLERSCDVFCFSEKLNHTGTFNGIVTGQCAEQTLENLELCCLVETFPSRHTSYYDFQRTLKYAYLYAKVVTLIPTHDDQTNEIIARNRRIGCSMSGIQHAIANIGLPEFIRWSGAGYKYIRALDQRYSEWLGVSSSIKTTSVKPSGTVSKLPGVSSGIHFDPAPYWMQVIRVQTDSVYADVHRRAGYRVVDLAPNEPNTSAIYFPMASGSKKVESTVSAWEQFEYAAKMQHYWADNQVSVTIKFTEQEREHVLPILESAADRLKSVSFLPNTNHGYSHAPMQPCSSEEYHAYRSSLKPVTYGEAIHETDEKFCDGDSCTVG